MKRLSDLIEKFWKNEATEKELQELLEKLRIHGDTWKAKLAKMYNEETSYSGVGELSAERVEALLRSIHFKAGISVNKQKMDNQRRIASHSFMRWTVAAAMALIVSVGVYLYNQRGWQEPSIAMVEDVRDTVVYTNVEKEAKWLDMPDGSRIHIFPNSSISFIEGFDDYARVITLTGKARFEVAKDTLRPFSVLADGYSTTALGTTFIVNTLESDLVSVQLLSGKVVVRSTGTNNFELADTYLNPGDKLEINQQDGKFIMSRPEIIPALKIKVKKQQSLRLIPTEEWYVFDKTPLNEVFSRLGDRYGYQITLNDERLAGLSFTGRFEPTGSIHIMLDIICSINNLEYIEEGDKFRIISK